ncbi:hypothetical protein C1H57_09055 [Clostridium sp. 2-1]|uniref:GTPase n=1 Tax=Clostridium TaxID=1485 RepID=UPI000CDA8CB5|nr:MULTISPECIES: GTPase [Clostridium]MBN7575319.1 50S ribosome-binding GTPase [Clostridium beijerinckii]MBN7580645.1 50S ribosome-binding GTPase [Clostridium beijerinckii]MBN7585083.1 50S ribosome-binding GTPase [Clostridium beijerinckii]MBO0520989.1 50S ribosome-binding GTPase [Clostridium beijerinckii]POO91652.1 hypothetical protein C1H57_09055 [Clostridium sp. 2-1]
MKNICEKLYQIENVDKKVVKQVEDKIKQLIEEESRINIDSKIKISCVGIYNAGKSTLLNTIVGKQIFKEGDIPTTSTVDSYETEDAIYYDTPGLNANNRDNKSAYNGYKESDVILFVSNIQSGGLSSAEAHFLKQIKNIMGTNDILKDNIIFLLSNKHRVDEEKIEKVVQQYKKNIKEVLDIEIDQIYTYDAITYQNGIDTNEQLLIEASGFIQINKVLNELIKSKNKNIIDSREERLKIKRNEAQNAVDNMILQIKNDIDKLRNEANDNYRKINQIEILQENYNNNIKEFINNLVASNEAPRKAYISFEYISSIYDKKSRYEVESYIKSKVESRYNKRESMVRREVSDLVDYYIEYLEYKEKEGNYYYDRNLRATKLILDYASKLKEFGIKLNSYLVQEIQAIPKDTKDIVSEMSSNLADDVVRYGQYYSVSYYTGLVDIDESEDYSRKGIFGGTKYKYSAWNLYAAIDEMQKDINGTLNSNINWVWGKIKNVIDKYNEEVKYQLKSRTLEFNKIMDEHKKMLRTDEKLLIANINDAVKSLSSYVNIPESL